MRVFVDAILICSPLIVTGRSFYEAPMLKVTDAQLEVLSLGKRAQFLRDLEARLTERNPHLVATFDDARMHAVVEGAVAAAATHGFTHCGPIRFYLDVCIAFGSGFADDPIYPWARQALGDPDPDTQSKRAEALFTRCTAAIDEIHGPEDVWTRDALAALLVWARSDRRFPAAEGLSDYAFEQMTMLHPQKAAHGGEAALRAIFDQAVRTCAGGGVDAPQPIMLITALKFAFGAGCLTDPIYGWIGATLRDDRVLDPADRLARLERKSLTWLEAVVARQTKDA
jgi:hypothetical protein